MIELIFVIVIIGILASVAIPKFSNLTSNAKISSELSTASAVETAIESAHSEWIVSDCNFSWGADKTSNCSQNPNSVSNEFNCSAGYPQNLGDCNNNPFKYILKNAEALKNDWNCTTKSNGIVIFQGPASKSNSGVKDGNEIKPDQCDYWEYNRSKGSFKLIDLNCS
ncbi:pilin [Hydrogenimonas thermophila]